MSDFSPLCTTLEAVRLINRHAAHLDAVGHHAEADHVDSEIRLVAIRLSANWMTNGWNAVQLGLHGGEPLYLLGTMRVQVTNLMNTVRRQRGYLTSSVQALAERLVQNVLAWLEQVQSDQFNAGGALDTVGSPPARTSSRQGTYMVPNRIAGASGMIESNARAALGVMQYLDRQELFPRGPEALRHINQNIQTLIALVNGSLPPEAVANQINSNEQMRSTSKDRVPQQEQAEGVRQSLGKGEIASFFPAIGNLSNDQHGQIALPYNREAHIQRYLDYMAHCGYDAMITHLKQHEGNQAFITEVKNRAQSNQWSEHQELSDEVKNADRYQTLPSTGRAGQGNADMLFNSDHTIQAGY